MNYKIVTSLEDGIQLRVTEHRRHENVLHIPPCNSQFATEANYAKNWRVIIIQLKGNLPCRTQDSDVTARSRYN